ncbi:hypothetical protein SDC9_196387 [bioreactor metagenome]|uniref:Uncharacterized protein n=1 Tax=bioreactor metagenome TaxID=1076179 RepID=A0A645IBW8_9ZZZZ
MVLFDPHLLKRTQRYAFMLNDCEHDFNNIGKFLNIIILVILVEFFF